MSPYDRRGGVGLGQGELVNPAPESASYRVVMSNTRSPDYFAQYQRRQRANARAAGFAQINTIVPGDLVARLDAMKQARGLPNRNAALAAVLREFFGRDADERNPAVSP
jgi:hypothetical protein